MPGICGFYNTKPQPQAANLAHAMVARLRPEQWQIVKQQLDPVGRFTLARVSLGILPSMQPVSLHDGRFHAVMDGELYETDAPDRDARLHLPQANGDDHTRAFLANYANAGVQSLDRLEGSFAAAIVDEAEETLALVNDRFGTRPLYYAHTPERFLFASSISSLLADPQVRRTLDWQGVSQFFTFGHYFNDNTSLSAVKVLPAGTALQFNARANRVSLYRYCRGLEPAENRPATRREAFDAVDDAFAQSVCKRQLSTRAAVGLSLSGGLDARTILGTLDTSRNNLCSLCLGMRGSRDHQVSTELARIAGCRHHNHVLDTSFLAEFDRHLEDVVRLTDGQYLSQCIVMPTLPLYRRLGIGILMRGHAGELMHMTKAYNYSLDAAALRLRTDKDLEEWLWRRLRAYLHDGVDGPLFAQPDLNQSLAARESLRQALADTPQSEPPANRIARLFVNQRVRRETMLSLMKFRSVTEPRLPYLDRKLVEQLLAMPLEWRLGDELQTYILQKRQPRFCMLDNTNTGAVLGAGRIRRAFGQFKLRVFSKLGVPGYQPYERLGLWLRRELASVVRSTLLTDSCLGRGVFAPDTLRRAVERHLSGQRNHTYLLLAAMVFERGHRYLFEEDDDLGANIRGCRPSSSWNGA